MSNTVFPSGIDAFIDPGPNTPENAAQPHHLMHSVANDAIAAMETTLLQQFMAYSPVTVPDLSKGNVIVIGTLTGNTLISQPINPASYSVPLVFVFTQDSSGGRVVSWDPSFITTWGIDPTPNNSSSIGFVYQSSSATWIPVHAYPDQVSITAVSGNLTINGNLTVNGQGFFSGTLNTAGISDTSGITTAGTLTAAGLNITGGSTSITGNLTITGSITAAGASGKITANAGLVVNGGGASITGNVNLTGSLINTGNLQAGGSLILSGSASIGGAATFSSTITASGKITGASFALGNNDFTVDTLGNIVGASLNTGSGNITCHTLTANTSITTPGPISSTGSGTISTSGTVSCGTLSSTTATVSGNATIGTTYCDAHVGTGTNGEISFWGNVSGVNHKLAHMTLVGGGTTFIFDTSLPALGGGNTVNYQAGGSNQIGYISSTALHKLNIRDLELFGKDNPIFKSRPVNFVYDPEKVINVDGEKLEAGFIAEELGEVCMEMVNTDGEGHPNTLNTFAILGYLADAVIYLKKELDAAKKA